MSTYGSERDQRQNRYRPNVSVKHLTNKSALMSFVAPRQVDAIDRIPSGSRIYAEMHRQESNEEMEVQCHGIDPTGFTCRVAHRESDDQQSSGDATVGHAEWGKSYGQQLKPFNFLLTCPVRAFGHPSGVDPERFHLIAPYESDPERWTEIEWIDQFTGTPYRITTKGHHGAPGVARVKTYGDVFEEYEWHPETKCADANGEPANKQTIGLLQRRHITIDHIIYIGRESNQLEDVDAGLVRAGDGYTEYPDPRRDYWQTAVVPALKQIPLRAWQRDTGKSAVILIDARRGRRQPHAKHRALLIMYARRRGLLS